MKKIFLLAVAAITLLSCADDESFGGRSRIIVNLEGLKTKTRVDQPAAGTAISPLVGTNHYVFVFNSDGSRKVHGEVFDAATLSSGGQSIGNGRRFSRSDKVYMLANIPDNISVADLEAVENFADVQALQTTISYSAPVAHTDYTVPVMANTNGQLQPLGATVGSSSVTVNIRIAPLYSRIEFEGLRGGSSIVSYDITGVFINKYRTSFTMNGTGAGPLVSVSSDVSALPTLFHDTGLWSSSTTTKEARSNNGVWAYHAAPSGDLPAIIVRIENVVVLDPNNESDGTLALSGARYIVIEPANYKTAGGATYSGGFERGKIYHVGVAEFNYLVSIIDPPPPPFEFLEVGATLTVDNWAVNDISTILE
jgi:hypothetical protein